MPIDYSKEEKESAIRSIQRFFEEEMETDIGELQATFLLDFFAKELAPLAYNQGVDDAKNYMMLKMEDVNGTCYEEAFSFWSKKRK
ncbi:MAG: DUF2164 domain-containing protein [Verrucomicrobiota bacterium]